jgi:gamma-glutamyltranspeptidase/glutathione hydrolase
MADRTTGQSFATRSEAIAINGMVATSHPLATQVGLDILKNGGHAVDSAIAANAALGLMEPTSCGVGGDLFAIIWDAEQKQLSGLNASGRSPRSLHAEDLVSHGQSQIPIRGPLPVTVPGAIDGWCEIHGRFGRLSLADVLAPTIEYARAGHPVTEVIASEWGNEVIDLVDWPGFGEQMTLGGRAPRKGEIWTNQNLAATLEKIAEQGRDAFYQGEIAEIISEYMLENNGFLCFQDLAAHHSEWVDPVSTSYRGHEVWELPPNGQGIAVLQMLNMLEPHDIGAMGFGTADYLHLLTEIKKLAYEEEYAAVRSKLINPRTAALAYPHGDPDALRKGDTTYLSTADSEGNMVSLIQSNYFGMGSGMTPPGLGFVLHNRGTMFSLDRNHFNYLEPGKRPFHTIIPGFVSRQGEPWMSFGVMGGDMQPQGHVQIITNLIDFGMNLQEAGDAPRMNHTGSSCPSGTTMSDGGVVNLESGFEESVVSELRSRGHRVEFGHGLYGGYQAITRDPETGVYHGASESRKDGNAAGY